MRTQIQDNGGRMFKKSRAFVVADSKLQNRLNSKRYKAAIQTETESTFLDQDRRVISHIHYETHKKVIKAVRQRASKTQR